VRGRQLLRNKNVILITAIALTTKSVNTMRCSLFSAFLAHALVLAAEEDDFLTLPASA